MSISDINKKWRLKQRNSQAGVDMWNSMAESFGEFVLPDFQENTFLRQLTRRNIPNPDALALDVGCGTGKYALALAGCCRHVTGIDLSPRMILIARQKKAEYNITNADFYCEDWHTLDIDEAGYNHQFDLVFAHMTPAVQSADTFTKLSAASKGWCAMAKPIKRIDPVSDALKELAGIKERRESADEDILFAFELLWRQGYLPQLEYEKQTWKMKKTLDEAYGLYINRLKTYRKISKSEEESFKAYLQTLTKDGFVYEDVDTTIVTLFWQVE